MLLRHAFVTMLSLAFAASSAAAWETDCGTCTGCLYQGRCYQMSVCSAGMTSCLGGGGGDMCKNTQHDHGTPYKKDEGCPKSKPVCIRDGYNYPLAADVDGDKCVKCFNTLESDYACDPDDGCTGMFPGKCCRVCACSSLLMGIGHHALNNFYFRCCGHARPYSTLLRLRQGRWLQPSYLASWDQVRRQLQEHKAGLPSRFWLQ